MLPCGLSYSVLSLMTCVLPFSFSNSLSHTHTHTSSKCYFFPRQACVTHHHTFLLLQPPPTETPLNTPPPTSISCHSTTSRNKHLTIFASPPSLLCCEDPCGDEIVLPMNFRTCVLAEPRKAVVQCDKGGTCVCLIYFCSGSGKKEVKGNLVSN